MLGAKGMRGLGTAAAVTAGPAVPSALGVRMEEGRGVPWGTVVGVAAAAVGTCAALLWFAGREDSESETAWEEDGRSAWLGTLLDHRRLSFLEKEQQIEISGLSLLQLLQMLHSPEQRGTRPTAAAVRYSVAASVVANRTFRFLAAQPFQAAVDAAEVGVEAVPGVCALPLHGAPVSVSLGAGAEAAECALRALGAIPFARGLVAVTQSVEHLKNPQGPQRCCGGLVGSAGAAHVATGGSFLDLSLDVTGEALLSAQCSAVPVFLPTPETVAWAELQENVRPALFARTAGDLLFAESHLCSHASAPTARPLRCFAVLSLGLLEPPVEKALDGAQAALQRAGLKAACIEVATVQALLEAWKAADTSSDAATHIRASQAVERLRRQILREMATNGVDALLCPSSQRSASAFMSGIGEGDRRHAVFLSLLGGPVGGLPFCYEEDGTAASVLVATAPLQDALCLETMILLERRSLLLCAMQSLRAEQEEEAEAAELQFSGFPPTNERRRFLFMHNQKFGNYGCMDREQELMPRPMHG